MVETNPKDPSGTKQEPSAAQTQPSRPQAVPQVDVGFDFVSFCVAVFVVSVLFTGAVFGYRFLILGRTITEQQQQIASLESELADPDLQELEKKAQEIGGGIDKIGPILNDPVRYAELFWTIRKVTEKAIRWRSLGFSDTQQLSLTGEAQGWGNLARQLAVLKQDSKFSKVDLTGASVEDAAGGARINFSVTMQVYTNKLLPPGSEITVPAGQ